MKKGLFSCALAVLAFVTCAPAAQAQMMLQPAPVEEKVLFDADVKEPDVNTIPILKNIVTGGGKLFYMGARSGLWGWFIVKQGQVQMIYVSQDRKTALIGAMFTEIGENVTGAQIRALSSRDKTVYELLNGGGRAQDSIAQAGSPDGGVAVIGSTAPQAKSGVDNGLPAAALSPGDRLYQDLEAAAGVVLGKEEAPELQIVVAPRCPNCKGTWAELRQAVKDGKIKVRLVPVYNSLGGEEAQQAAQLLRAKNPYEAWDKHVDGDQAALSGKADDIALKAVVGNLDLVSKWNIKGYPYLVYRNKEGKVKIVQGRPERMGAVLLDLTR